MNILFLAPQPFYGERGTPIAVDLALKVLSERGDPIDVLAYHLGEEVSYPNTRIHRTLNLPFIKNIPPGFSWKKLVCDFFMLLKVLDMVRRKRYHLVHAVEESVFLAMLLKAFFKIPYIYDMDSSMAQQLVEKSGWLAPLTPLLSFFEGRAVKGAKAVVPVCEALSLDIEKHKPEKMVILWDVSLLENDPILAEENLRERLRSEDLLVLYVGNLETYQGIDLLLESFTLALKQAANLQLVVIGGKEADIQKYREHARRLEIDSKVHFLGPKPVARLAAYLAQADILVSPRIKGKNTPMKIYSYLGSGKPVLATDLPTHTQVLNSQVAVLAGAVPEAYAAGLVRLAEDAVRRARIGQAGKRLIEERHTFQVFRQRLNVLYNWIRAEVDPAARSLSATTKTDLAQRLPIELYEHGVSPQELRIHYQPIVSLETGRITGFEALVRWNHPDYGLVAPTEFISVAEDSGQIIPIGRWVLHEACRQMKAWEDQYPSALPLTISVNLSAKQIQQPDLIEQIDQILEETGIDTQSLNLEISDRAIAASPETTASTVIQLRARGVQFHVDLDSAGEADLSALQGIPISSLKIDPAFISGMALDGKDSGAVQKAVALARSAGIDVVAVGVETMAQLKKLKELKCDYGQGFFFSKPLDSEAAAALISISGLERLVTGPLVAETGEQIPVQPSPVELISPLT
jgi:EAL domain-containing protein (putative c-di-GMP-specific phosphodiesterase class I)/glycosyltransferase involved in cell wall biosynthesis